MRILHLIESLEFGGAEKVAIDLANETAKRHEVTICCVKKIGDLRATVDSSIRVLCLEKGEGNDYLVPFRLAKILRQLQIDVLHAHNWGVFLEAALAGLFAKTPVLIETVHGPYMDYAPGISSQLKRRLRHRLEKLFASRFFKIVTVSDSIRQYICNEIGIHAGRLVTIHNGIQTQSIEPKQVRKNEVICITVGRLAGIKNQTLMLRAFALVRDTNSRLWLVGDGPERARLEAMALDLGLSKRVTFVGFRHDVADLLAQSDIFLMSSHYEGVSIAVLEAMRARLPVIGTRVGGMPETVNERTGILVEPGDVHAMSSALDRLVGSPVLRRTLGAAGNEFLQLEFSIQNMVARYELLYEGKPA